MKLYREDQKYHDILALGMIAILSGLLMVTVITQSVGLWKAVIGGLAVAAIFFVVRSLRLKIRISPKKMSVRIAPLPWMTVKMPKDEVTGVEFISSVDAEIANGWAVHYGGHLRMFNFGDRKGMIIRRADGRDVVVLSRKLYEEKEEILNELKLHGWNLA